MQTKPLKQPLELPFIPKNSVSKVLISEEADEEINSLENMGICCIKVQNNPRLLPGLGSHADMNYFHYKNNELYCLNSVSAGEWAQNFSVIKIKKPESKDYPNDVMLNAVRLGKYFICNEKTVSKEILDSVYKDGLNIVNVNQGYTKCSVCVLSEDAVITDDISIYNELKYILKDVTLITKGSVKLNGFNYGFIGGCSGLTAKNKIAFCGEIISHKDHNLIYDALNRNKIDAVELKKGRLTDVGSIIPIEEYFI